MMSSTSKFFIMCQLLLLLLFIIISNNNGRCNGYIVKTLPGFQGPLPFTLETGYVGVEDSEIFYYFVESTGKPRIDPLMIYINGGPACSALNGLIFQTGPLEFNKTEYSGGLPQLILRTHTWTKTASIIYPDVPVGSGFSYSTTSQDYNLTDTITVRQIIKFLIKWLDEHPKYMNNRFYIVTDSYSGLWGPVLAQQILERNAAGIQPIINLIGLLSGSPHSDDLVEANARIPQAHNLALISDELYEAAKENCHGSYENVDSSNVKCVEALLPITQCLADIYQQNVLEPLCATLSPKPDDDDDEELGQRALMEISEDWYCKNFVYILSSIWANNKIVQDALHVREGTIRTWRRCNLSLINAYTADIHDAVPYHKNLTTTGLQVLLYTGDHDLVVPHIATEGWLRCLNITLDDPWMPWFVDGQVAGYKVAYSNTGYRLTYATLKGAGHSPTEYFPERCFKMFERWIHFYPL